MPPTDIFWGDRLGQVVDPFGIKWTIATHIKALTPADMKKAEEAFIAANEAAEAVAGERYSESVPFVEGTPIARGSMRTAAISALANALKQISTM